MGRGRRRDVAGAVEPGRAGDPGWGTHQFSPADTAVGPCYHHSKGPRPTSSTYWLRSAWQLQDKGLGFAERRALRRHRAAPGDYQAQSPPAIQGLRNTFRARLSILSTCDSVIPRRKKLISSTFSVAASRSIATK